MKRFILSVLAAFAVSVFGAVAQDFEEVVYLKNGSVVRGLIVECVPGVSLQIQTRDGSTFVFRMDEVEKLTREFPERRYHKYGKASLVKHDFNKYKGYFGLLELGMAPGLNGYDPFRAGLTIVNGYRILPQFAVGIGVGLQYYTNFDEATVPLFLHLRSDILNSKVSPFVAFNAGYNISFGGLYDGVMMEPSVGVGFNVGDSYRMTAGLGFSVDRIQYEVYAFRNTYSFQDWAFALNIKVGFSF